MTTTDNPMNTMANRVLLGTKTFPFACHHDYCKGHNEDQAWTANSWMTGR